MMSQRPNILLLMTDQQRPDSLGCYGDNAALTPNLDRLAQAGVVFENCYVQNPLCCPSRYSILTGRYPHAHRVISNWYAPRSGERSFGHQLGRVGYRTAMIGKMHLTPWHDTFGFDGRIIAEAKFDVECPDDYAAFLQAHGTSRRALYDFQDPEYLRRCTAITANVPQDLHIDTFVGRSVCEYLRHVQEPFCCFASFLSPHNPYDPPEPYNRLFASATLPERNMYAGEVADKPKEAYDYINTRLKWPNKTDQLSAEQIHLMKSHYYALNTLVDDWIGRIIEVLQAQDQYENTIIIYTSDHGDLLGDHGLIFKQCFYEQSVKAPLIIHAPAYFQARRVRDLVESLDIFTTICELGQAGPGEGIHGKNLLPLLRGESGDTHRHAVFSENYFGKMVRDEHYKMVYYTGKPYGELYDLEADPLERRNLWEALEGSAVKRHLKDLLLEWMVATEDTLPLPVRPDHFDHTPRQMTVRNGATALCERQPWYLEDLLPLYADWALQEHGIRRT